MKGSRAFLPLLLVLVLFFFIACYPPETAPVKFGLNITVEGEGRIYPSSGAYEQNMLLVFDIEPAQGWFFSNWEGENKYDLTESYNRWQLKMDGNKRLTAVFKRLDDGSQPGSSYSLTVNVLGGGNIYPSSGKFPAYQQVKLDVRPENGWLFERWEGPNKQEIYGNNNNYLINMDGDKILIAVFQEDNCRLDISVLGKGRVEERLMGTDYVKGSMVRLTALADTGWEFEEWQGDVSGKNEIIYLEIEKDTSIRAVFTRRVSNYTLTVELEGQGKVEEKLISGQEYEEGSIVQLIAKPENGWLFKEWLGDLRDTKRQVYVELDCDKKLKAVFIKDSPDHEYYLGIKVKGDGLVTKTPNTDYYEHGEVVSLTARASKGWQFISWSGDASGTRANVKVTMDKDKEITALFEKEEKETYRLELEVFGNGQVSKNPDKERYEEEEWVTLTATAEPAWYFKEWQGDLATTSSQVRLVMDGHKRITAIFEKELKYYRLNVNVLGSGSISKSPDLGEYEEGTTVYLTASPANGWEFQGWSGDASGSTGSTQITMDSDKHVTATFRSQQGQGYILTTKVGGGTGSIVRSPDQDRYSPGTKVFLRASPGPCYKIHYWTVDGRQVAYQDSVEVTMNKDIAVIAYFQFTG